MRRSFRRPIVLCALAGAAPLAAVAAVVIGTWPYERPVIALEPGGENASFDGTALHLVWVHGMCTHDLNWATDRATRIATALGAAATRPAPLRKPTA